MQYACVATLAGFMMFYEPNCAVTAGAVTNLNFAMTPLLAPGQAHKRAHTHTHTHAHTRTRTTWALPFDPRLAPGMTSLCFLVYITRIFLQFFSLTGAWILRKCCAYFTCNSLLRVLYVYFMRIIAHFTRNTPTGRPFFWVFGFFVDGFLVV